jgi:transcriptional regulator with XRE-family HTH domain
MSIEIGSRVKAWRESRVPKITQSTLADSLGISQATVSSFETGVHRIGEEEALKLEEVSLGEISAEDCVRDDRRWLVLEIKANRSKGAA